jgi:hypothetical protein
MELAKESKVVMKYEMFREGGRWEDICKNVCSWVNTSCNTSRITGITALNCVADNKNLVTVYYNDGQIAPDIRAQTSNLVLCYEIFTMEKNVQFSWHVHSGKIVGKIGEISERGQIISICSL